MYYSIKDWLNAIKKDWNKLFSDGKIANKTTALLLIQMANIILISAILFALSRVLGQYIELSREYTGATMFIMALLWQTLLTILKGNDFEIADRFSISEISNFSLRPSYYIFFFLLLINILIMILFKLLPLKITKEIKQRNYAK